MQTKKRHPIINLTSFLLFFLTFIIHLFITLYSIYTFFDIISFINLKEMILLKEFFGFGFGGCFVVGRTTYRGC